MSFPELHKACILHPGEDKLTTDIVVQSFTDRHVIIITQIGKMGTIISAECDTSHVDGRNTYTLNTLLGKRDDPLLDVYARQLIERIASTSQKPLLLTIALKPEGRSVETMEAILTKIIELKTW